MYDRLCCCCCELNDNSKDAQLSRITSCEFPAKVTAITHFSASGSKERYGQHPKGLSSPLIQLQQESFEEENKIVL